VLQQLTIRNFATIDHLHVEWRPGLNVITGETGAGKSILIDAVGALLGDRLGPDVVRGGAERAMVEGVFVLGSAPPPDLQAVIDEYGLEPEDGALIVSRDIAGSGARGGARVNGRSVPLTILQELGEQLVDVHGQSQHMALLRPREQLEYLDRYAGVLAQRTQLAGLVRQLRAVRDNRRVIVAEERETARLQDMLRHEVAEIERAELRAGEDDDLRARQSRLEHVEKLRTAASLAHQALSGVDADDQAGAIDLLNQAIAACSDGARFDAALSTEAESLNTALMQAEESARALRDYVDGLEADPDALERATERLFLIGDLKRKFGESIPDVLAYASDARQRLGEIERRAERLSELDAREQQLLLELSASAADLSKRRSSAAEQLAAAIERELRDLRLSGTRFCVSVTQQEDADGLTIGGRRLAIESSGVDKVEFLLAAHSGEEPRSLSRVASGGELSRIALALKTILSRAETRPTLIFDEIDVGVGGRTAPVIGEKLWAVAGSGHQVLCVTHLPQVAVFADGHYVVSKDLSDARAETRVHALGDADRLDELASMLAGDVTDSVRQSALELLERAAAFKKKR
jgi:DNA repair protein RecN (Recombination protein N)